MSQRGGGVLETNNNQSWLGGRLNYQYLDPNAKKARAVGYHPDGKLSFKYYLNDGKLDGLCKAWHENGQLNKEEVFIQGKLLLSKEWFSNGQIKSETPYRNGMIQGTCKTWYENGQLCSQGEHNFHMRHGITTHWYPDGRLKSRERFERGLPHGINNYWDESGKLKGKKIFIEGVLITNKIHNLVNSGELSAKHILEIKNAAVRRVCLEELGYEKFLAQLEHEVIDKKEDYELIRINWHKREEPICLVKVKCPSTGAYYTLRVPPRMKTVQDAVAWTFEMKAKEYDPEKET